MRCQIDNKSPFLVTFLLKSLHTSNKKCNFAAFFCNSTDKEHKLRIKEYSKL